MPPMKAGADCDRRLTTRALIGVLSLTMICLVMSVPVAGDELSIPQQSPAAAPMPEGTSIPVATDAGVIPMSQRQYDEYIRPMGHLPIMSRSYIFGHTIPRPNTDKFGHIHLSNPSPPARRNIEQVPSRASTVAAARSKGATQALPSSDRGTGIDVSPTPDKADHEKDRVRDPAQTRELGPEPASR